MRQYYDVLFQDLEGTKTYESFVRKHAKGKTMIECACGTGDLLSKLSNQFEITGIDLDDSMLEKGRNKYPEVKDQLKKGNFLTYDDGNRYDTLVCVGDSLNYLDSMTELEMFVLNASKLSDTLILDMHHPYRLKEFADSYFEEGSTDSFDYMYIIEVDNNQLVHTINFLDGTFDQVLQWVFEPTELKMMLEKVGYDVQVFTDFDINGISDEGEKVMFVCNRNK